MSEELAAELRPVLLKFYIVSYIESGAQMLFDLISKKERFFDCWLVAVIGVLDTSCC